MQFGKKCILQLCLSLFSPIRTSLRGKSTLEVLCSQLEDKSV